VFIRSDESSNDSKADRFVLSPDSHVLPKKLPLPKTPLEAIPTKGSQFLFAPGNQKEPGADSESKLPNEGSFHVLQMQPEPS